MRTERYLAVDEGNDPGCRASLCETSGKSRPDAGDVVKTKVSHPGKTLPRRPAPTGRKSSYPHTDHGWFLKEKGSSAEPKLLFEELLTSEGKPVQVYADYGPGLDVIGWY